MKSAYNITEHLDSLPLFQGLTRSQLANLALHMGHLELPSNASLITLNDKGDFVYILLSGTVKVCLSRKIGSNVIVAICGTGEVFGDVNALDGMGHSADVVTLMPCVFLSIHNSIFLQWLELYPLLSVNVARNAMRRLRLSTATIEAFATQDVYGRVAGQILAFAQQFGQRTEEGNILIPLHLTQGDLAQLVGASRMRVNQVIGAFRRFGYLSVDEKSFITIYDENALLQRARNFC